jgi:hypothetical protein
MATNIGITPPDYNSPIGLVRVLVGDTDAKNIVDGKGEYAFYSDDELDALLSIYAGNVRRTAIIVLTNVAMSRALLLGKWTSDDLSVDGPAIIAAMEKTIKRLADELANEEAGADVYFDIVPTGIDRNSYRTHAEGTAHTISESYSSVGW